MNIDEKWMKIALNEANLAMNENEIPVGAVLVKNDELIAQSHNQPVKKMILLLMLKLNSLEKLAKNKKTID